MRSWMDEELVIHNKKELIELAEKLKVRNDWHEPDEQGLDIRVTGYRFDNAHCDLAGHEYAVIIYKDGEAVAVVNIALLLAWATGYVDR